MTLVDREGQELDRRRALPALEGKLTEEGIRSWLIAYLAERLEAPPQAIAVHESFSRHGLDSLGATRMLAELGKVLGRSLSPTLVWEHATIEALARHLVDPARPRPAPERAAPPGQGEEEPIAIVGMACHFPRASSAAAFWELLRDGVDAVTEVPADRWDVDALYDPDLAAPGKMNTRWGGFLEGVDRFDPQFFGISPREAIHMDPQQRLMLHVAWEALEDAGIPPVGLAGSATGVFVGTMWGEYARDLGGSLDAIAPHTATGQDTSIVSARLSYTLGLQGPSLTVNTACSSSLVALHLACQSLRSGDSTLALVGGVNLIFSPESTVAMSKFGGLSPDGRCFTFDARANGYVRGEGCAVVVLKPLSRALADGDRIACLIRGSALNNDGASNGLTAPNPAAQEAVLRSAYERAGIDPATVDYVEAHGTGTPLGDPIEASALGAVLGAGRPADRPLLTGSAKTNIGHLEGAAGMAGVIKVALSLTHRQIPPSLHFETPNPHIPLAELGLSVVRELTPWPQHGGPSVAGVSAFGFGGTNGHVVLEGWSPGPVFAFSGQGSQWPGMGRSLLAHEPVFRAALARCDGLIEHHLGWSLLDLLSTDDHAGRLDEIDVSFPAIVAIEIALAALWRSWGIEPAAVVGHSVGEISAAHVAGALSLEDAMLVICAQGRTIRRIQGQGAMGVVALSWEQAAEAIAGHPGLCRAIHTAPSEVVLAGDPAALDEVLDGLARRGVFCRRVAMGAAAHSAQLDPLRGALLEELRPVTPREAAVPFISTVTGTRLDGARLDAAHWVRNLAEPVLFAEAIHSLSAHEGRVFLEISPHPLVSRAVSATLERAGRQATVLSSLRRGEDERAVLRESLDALHTLGQPVRWEAVHDGAGRAPASSALLVLSARSTAALDAAAARLGEHLEAHPEPRLGDVAFSLATTRSAMEHRLAVTASSREELRAALAAAAQGQTPAGAVRGAASPRGKLAFLFTGQGAQVPGMGRGLCEAWPAFRDAFDRCVDLFDRELERPLREAMWAEPGSAGAARLDQTGTTQPALFTVEYALAALWRSWGVTPELVAGHSIGELVAACVGGVFSLENAVKLVAARGRLMQALPAGGVMVSIAAPEAEVAAAVAAHAAEVSIAAVNGPAQVVIAGAEGPVQAIAASFASRGARTRPLRVSHAFHSPLMEPMLEAFARVAASVSYQRPTLPLVSNVSGELCTDEVMTPSYWVRHVREAVRFADGVKALYQAGARTFVEVGPRATLLGLLPACVPEAQLALVATLRGGREEAASVLEALGSLWAGGGSVDWSGVFPKGGRRVSLPTYPWQRERYWLDLPEKSAHRAGEATGHPLLGARLPAAGTGAVFEATLGLRSHRWLGDHRVAGQVWVPGVVLAEVLWAAAARGAVDDPRVEGMVLHEPLTLPETGARRVQVVLTSMGAEAAVYSQPAESGASAAWTLHATATIGSAEGAPLPAALPLDDLRRRCVEPLELAAVAERCAAVGLARGPAFQGLRALRRGPNEALAEVALPAQAPAMDSEGVSPALLDAALQAVVAAAPEPSPDLLLPSAIGGFTVHQPGAEVAWVHVRRRGGAGGAEVVADVTLADATGAVVAEVTELRLQRVDRKALRRVRAEAPAEMFYRLAWRETPLPAAPPGRLEGSWVVVAATGSAAAAALAARLGPCVVTEPSGLRATLAAEAAVTEVVCLWETRADEAVPAAAQRVATDGLAVVQALRGRSPVRLWWVTTGAAAVEPGDVVEAGTAPVWGLGRTVMQEHPELGCTLVDVEPGAPDVEALARELGTNDGESQVAWRAGRRRVARLVRAAPMTADVPAPIPTRGTVLVTGGLGALGLHVARWLAQQGVPHLVLTGRRGLGTTGAAEAVAELEALGARVTVAAVDVADREGLRAVLAAIPTEWPLRGVVHAAGVLDDGVLAEQTMERFARVLSPKVAGSWNLHELTAGDDLAFFVLFSSVAGLLGAGGQGNYAAANTFLDALAAHRRRKGLAGQSVAWGPWSEGGKAAGLGAEQKARLARQGMGALSPSEGVALLGQALGRPEAMLGAVRLDLPAVGRAFGEAVPPVWRTLVRAPARPAAAGVQGSWAARLAALPPAEREGEVRAAVQADLARVLGLGVASEVPADRRFSDLGLDSLMAVELRNTLGRRLGKTLPASLAFEHPTIDGLTHWLVEQLSSAPAAPSLGAPDEEILVIPLEGDEAFERFATLSSQVYARIQVKAGMWSPEGAERLSRQMLDDLLPQGLSTPHHSICTLVEPTRGEPVGHHWCGRREVDKVSVFYWYSMEIAESHQGKGYGPQVMKLLEEKAREQHVRFALANVGAANPWRSMLHKLGWSDTTGRLMKRVDALPAEGRSSPALQLIPLEGNEAFERFATLSSQVYARDQVNSGLWSPEGAEPLARQVLNELLPGGLSTPHHCFYTLVEPDRGEPVGYLWYGPREADKVRVLHCHRLIIFAGHRRKGHGLTAMRLVEEKARAQDLRFVLANVNARDQASRAMLQKLGWSEVDWRLMKPVGSPA